MEWWHILIVLVISYLILLDWLENRKNIASIPKLEKDIIELREKEKKLTFYKKKILDNVICYREKYENDKKRKIYFANKRKKRTRKFY